MALISSSLTPEMHLLALPVLPQHMAASGTQISFTPRSKRRRYRL